MQKFRLGVFPLLLLTMIFGCSDQAPEREIAENATTKLAASCLQLDLSKGLASNEDLSLAISCLEASLKYPRLTEWLGQHSTEHERTELRTWANQLAAFKVLPRLSEVVGIWQERVGAETIQELAATAADLFRIGGQTETSRLSQLFGMTPIFTQFFESDLRDRARSEALRVSFSQLIQDGAFADTLLIVSQWLSEENASGQRPLEEALQQTVVLAQNRLSSFWEETQKLTSAAAFSDLEEELTPEIIVAALRLTYRTGISVSKIASTLARLERPTRCTDDIRLPGNLASKWMSAVLDKKGNPSKILANLPLAACGLSQDDVDTLERLSLLVKSQEGLLLQRMFAPFLARDEQKVLVAWMASLSTSGLIDAWEEVLKPALDTDRIDLLLAALDAVWSVEISLPGEHSRPLVTYLLAKLGLTNLSPDTVGAALNLISNLDLLAIAYPTANVLKNRENIEKIMDNIGILLKLRVFYSIRSLWLTLKAEPLVWEDALFSVGNSVSKPLFYNAILEEEPEVLLYEGIRFLSDLSILFGK